MAGDTTQKGAGSQTLSRGIRILEALAEAREPLAIDEIARRLGVHRSIAYRLLRTLEDHALVVRDAAGRMGLGPRMAALASAVAPDLQSAAMPELTAVAEHLAMTCFLGVLDRDECITLASAEPRHGIASVAQRAGARHPVTVGAAGKAILACTPRDEWPTDVSEHLRREVAEVVARGYATSRDEVLSAVGAVSVPLPLHGRRPASLTVVHLSGTEDPAAIAARLQRAADAIRAALEG